MRVAIIGASHAGVTAAKQLKQLDASLEVVLIERTHTLAYLANTLNLMLSEQLTKLDEGKQITISELITLGIHVMLDTNVTNIDPKQKELTLISIDQTVETLTYDRLILAMGSTQTSIPDELKKGEITTYKSFPQAKIALDRFQQAKSITIIGAGLIGLELADALSGQEKELILIDRMDDVLFRYFDSELTAQIKHHLQHFATIYLDATIKKVEPKGKQQVIHLQHETITSEVIVYAVNPRPSIELVQDFLTLTPDGTIYTDMHLKTSDPDIYAVGDLVSLPFKNTQMNSYIPLLSNAITTGLVAAQNIVSHDQLACPEVQRTVVSSFFGLHVASSGLTQEEAPYYGLTCDAYTKTFYPKAYLHAHDLDEPAFIKLKLVYRRDTKQLIGGQLLTNVSHYLEWIDLISLSINQETTIPKLAVMDFYFQPRFNEPIHPISQVALDILDEEHDT